MPSYFRESRNLELSLLYYLETNLNADWSGTTVCKTFKRVYAKDVSLPIVCAYLDDTITGRREIGSTTLEDRHLIIVDIFARSNSQRLDMADYVKDKLKDGWVHYNHSHASGDKSSLERAANGRDFVTEFISDGRVDFGVDADEKDKYRQRITIRVRKSS